MFGYMIAALSSNYFPGIFTWRSAIMFQAICELPVVIAFLYQDNEYVDVLSKYCICAKYINVLLIF